jgi:hypothetical protein
MTPEPLLSVDVAACEPVNEGSAAQVAAAVGEVVAFVGMQIVGSPTRPPNARPDRGNGVD